MLSTPPRIQKGLDYLSEVDTVMSALIAFHPVPQFTAHTNYYQELVESIISQQLSVKAAATINKRFVENFAHFPTPDEIIACDVVTLRACGLSGQKVGYIKDLATKVIDDTVQFDHLDRLSNEAIVTELTLIKGVGEWTAHMFLMFCMGRLDVLATGDLGVRTGLMRLYDLDHLPSSSEMHELAMLNRWHPYQSIVCWYAWKSLDNEPKT